MGIGSFARQVRRIARNVRLGRDEDRSDRKAERWGRDGPVALGQGRWWCARWPGIMHIPIYGASVPHQPGGPRDHHRRHLRHPSRIVLPAGFYDLTIAVFGVAGLGGGGLRRVPRPASGDPHPALQRQEMTSWPKREDAVYILSGSSSCSWARSKMNAVDQLLQERGAEHFVKAGFVPSQQLAHAVLSRAWTPARSWSRSASIGGRTSSASSPS